MSASTARIVAGGVLVGLLAIGIAVIAINTLPQAQEQAETVMRNVKIVLTPATVRTGTTSTVTVTARDGEGNPLTAWDQARIDTWLVRSDLTYAEHRTQDADGATSSFAVALRPTQPGSYKLVSAGVQGHVVTIGSAVLGVSGKAEDVAPQEQSAGREAYKLVMSTIPEAAALRVGEPVAFTFNVSRTGVPVPLTEIDDVRGSFAAFKEGGTMFVRGEPSPGALLPTASSAAFTMTFPEPGKYRVFFKFGAGGSTFMEARWIDVRPATQ